MAITQGVLAQNMCWPSTLDQAAVCDEEPGGKPHCVLDWNLQMTFLFFFFIGLGNEPAFMGPQRGNFPFLL